MTMYCKTTYCRLRNHPLIPTGLAYPQNFECQVCGTPHANTGRLTKDQIQRDQETKEAAKKRLKKAIEKRNKNKKRHYDSMSIFSKAQSKADS